MAAFPGIAEDFSRAPGKSSSRWVCAAGGLKEISLGRSASFENNEPAFFCRKERSKCLAPGAETLGLRELQSAQSRLFPLLCPCPRAELGGAAAAWWRERGTAAPDTAPRRCCRPVPAEARGRRPRWLPSVARARSGSERGWVCQRRGGAKGGSERRGTRPCVSGATAKERSGRRAGRRPRGMTARGAARRGRFCRAAEARSQRDPGGGHRAGTVGIEPPACRSQGGGSERKAQFRALGTAQRTSRTATSPSRTAGMSSTALVLEWEWLLGALARPGKKRNGIILAAAGGGFLLSGCSSE
ncbi:uncharacterized protein LOC116454343 [Corvus moneduloides]|uniref:uncharacterized protein LOC116454343 n=1 Tax=Corvus moneduloides TaxID=1196302 RepID=UPI0013626519|nr:uncharacterized protein LOC116454343 [Corvus moneduloides]